MWLMCSKLHIKNEVININREQQKIVEDNHNLIYSFARSYKVDLYEYYDVLAIGLCEAALVFDTNKGFQFSTLAYQCMKNEMRMIKRKEDTQRTIPEHLVCSLQDTIYISDSDGDETTLEETIVKDIFPNPEKSVVNSIMYREFYNSHLNNRERTIVNLLLKNKTQNEIADLISLTQPTVCRIIKGIKNKWTQYNQ